MKSRITLLHGPRMLLLAGRYPLIIASFSELNNSGTMITGRWIISCALPCITLTRCRHSLSNPINTALILLSFQCFSRLTLKIRFVPFRCDVGSFQRATQKFTIKSDHRDRICWPNYPYKGSEDSYSKQANKVSGIMMVYRRKCRDSVLQYIKDA